MKNVGNEPIALSEEVCVMHCNLLYALMHVQLFTWLVFPPFDCFENNLC